MTKRHVAMRVNGRDRNAEVEPRRLLSDFLREDLGLTGTHVGCEHGVCGACTVQVDGEAVRSCLMFAVQANGAEIATVESLATRGELNALQTAFHEHHALQCGFCTPGILMSMTALLVDDPDPSPETIRVALSGNLCRCTGYLSIVAAVRTAAHRLAEDRGAQ